MADRRPVPPHRSVRRDRNRRPGLGSFRLRVYVGTFFAFVVLVALLAVVIG